MTPTEPKTVSIPVDQDTAAITPDVAAVQTLDLRITDAASYTRVAAAVAAAKDRVKQITEWAGFYGTTAEPGAIILANAAHKKLTAQFSKVCAPYETVVKDGTSAMKSFDLAEKRRLDQEEADRQRAIREQEDQAKAIEDQKCAEAERLRKDGLIKEARQVEAAPPPVLAAPVGPISAPAPVAVGQAKKFQFVGKVDSVLEILKAIASGKIPLEYDLKGDGEMRPLVVVDMAVLNALAKTRQKDLGIPGCRSFESVSYSRSRQ